MLTGYKTLIFAVLVAIFGALESFDFTSFLNEQTAGIVTTVIGIIVFALRAKTKTPMLKK